MALVLSILVPSVGNWWYSLTAVSPATYVYYMQKGTRPEQVWGGSPWCMDVRAPTTLCELEQMQMDFGVQGLSHASWMMLCLR